MSRHDNLDEGIRSTHLHSEGKHAKELSLIGPSTKKWVHEVFENYDPDDKDYHPYMNGQLVFKNAVVRFSEVILEALAKNKLKPSDIDMLIPHQANLRIAQFVQKKFCLRDDQLYNNIMRYGNTTAASIPIALCEAWEEGLIKTGDNVMLAAFWKWIYLGKFFNQMGLAPLERINSKPKKHNAPLSARIKTKVKIIRL